MAEKQFNIIDKDKSLDELCKNSIDLVEYNPTFDIDNKTKIIALNILNKFLNNF